MIWKCEFVDKNTLSTLYGGDASAISKISQDQKTPDDLYRRRLNLCQDCEFLQKGTCLKCGCYVELWAAMQDSHCPLKDKWW